MSRTLLKAGFVALAYLATGRFVISAFAMLLLVFMTDFAKIALATDNVRGSPAPDTWNIRGFVAVAAGLGAMMVLEALALLYLFWPRLGLAHDDAALATVSFLTLLYFAVFSVVSARERRRFWQSRPGGLLVAALLVDLAVGTAAGMLGLPGLSPLPGWAVATTFLYAAAVCLLVNDFLKAAMLRRCVRGTT